MVEIWYLYLKQNEKTKKLPLIITLLIYHGKKKWSVNNNFSYLIEETTLKEYIPDFKYKIFDISHLTQLEKTDINNTVINIFSSFFHHYKKLCHEIF